MDSYNTTIFIYQLDNKLIIRKQESILTFSKQFNCMCKYNYIVYIFKLNYRIERYTVLWSISMNRMGSDKIY